MQLNITLYIVITCDSAKVTPENLNELTALDVARNWGDDYIYAIMYAKAGASQTTSASDKKGTQLYYANHMPFVSLDS